MYTKNQVEAFVKAVDFLLELTKREHSDPNIVQRAIYFQEAMAPEPEVEVGQESVTGLGPESGPQLEMDNPKEEPKD